MGNHMARDQEGWSLKALGANPPAVPDCSQRHRSGHGVGLRHDQVTS